MKVLIVGILVLALAVAGVSTYLIQTFSGERNIEELQKEAQKPKIRVLIAARRLNPGETLRPGAMAWQAWVDEAMNPLFTVVENDDQQAQELKEFTGATVRRLIYEGEPILASKVFKSENAGFLAGRLEGGKRAVSFAISPTTGVSGFILPGDRVDILLTHDKVIKELRKKEKLQGKADPDAPLMVIKQTTETIMRNVRVLAINQVVMHPSEGIAMTGNTVTFELTPKQAEVLVTARTMGTLSLALRSLEPGKDELAAKADPKKLSYTTDVEVSPFLSNINAIMEERKKAQEARRRARELKEAAAREKEAAARKQEPEAEKAAIPLPKKKRVIKIFRGGKAPQVITVK